MTCSFGVNTFAHNCSTAHRWRVSERMETYRVDSARMERTILAAKRLNLELQRKGMLKGFRTLRYGGTGSLMCDELNSCSSFPQVETPEVIKQNQLTDFWRPAAYNIGIEARGAATYHTRHETNNPGTPATTPVRGCVPRGATLCDLDILRRGWRPGPI